MAIAEPVIDAQSVANILSEIAEIASETLELQDVFDRVATAIRELIPFDNMGVVRLVDGDRAVLHASTFPCKGHECIDPIPLTAWSPRMRPRAGANPRINDAKLEFDPSFQFDSKALEGGVRSAMWEPFRPTSTLRGGVWLSSYTPNNFTDEHQQVMRPIAALLGSAVEHWRLWDIERRRRDRLDRVEVLLSTMAESLDVRELFQRLSDAMQAILPHELMCLTELDHRSESIQITAWAGNAGITPPTDSVKLTKEELNRRVDHEVIYDIQAEIKPDTDRQRLILTSGLRSWLRVPVWISGEVQGGLSFFHREPARYTTEDTEVAIRFADRVALMLSHHRLSEEARVAAETRERAERLEATVETLQRELAARSGNRVAGVSRSWKGALRDVGRVAPSETTVLITGESGTGKEVISSLVHQGSPRAKRPFVAINCAALPEQLLESELFGHERGAFTGAVTTKIGRIEQAAGGTLFLDEIAEMSPIVQAKFLRVLEEREFQRVGGTRAMKADIRVIAATNRDLKAAIARQTFREDLFYRLNVFQIHIAPLRERPDDILPLAEIFLADLGRSMGRPAAGISRDGREWLLAYPWPGNVRELRNAIERAILLCDGGLITRDHLPAPLPQAETAFAISAPATNGDGNGMDLGAVEKNLLVKALSQSKGNKTRAARLLGISRAQIYSRIEKYGVR